MGKMVGWQFGVRGGLSTTLAPGGNPGGWGSEASSPRRLAQLWATWAAQALPSLGFSLKQECLMKRQRANASEAIRWSI